MIGPAFPVLEAKDFIRLWTDEELVAALSHPVLRAAAFRASLEGVVDVSSPRMQAIFAIALADGVLTAERHARISAGLLPE